MKRLLMFNIVVGLFFGISIANADEIQNIKVTPADNNTTFIEWEHLSNNIMHQSEGYAIQWSKYESKMRNIDPATKYVKASRNSIALMTSITFEPNEFYFLRIYSYIKEGRHYILSNGSKIFKFKLNNTRDAILESEFLEANDPVVSDTSSSSLFDFGKLRIIPYDTYAVLSWSRPNLTKSDANGVIIVLSDDQNFSDSLIELKAGLDITSGKFSGLTPDTTYYAKGYFYKTKAGENHKFGEGSQELFKTKKPFSAAQKARIQRLKKRGLIKDRTLVTATIPGSETTSTNPPSSDSSSSNSDSQNTTTNDSTGTSSDSSSSHQYTRAEILKKIRNLETELTKWRRMLVSANRTKKRNSPKSKTRTIRKRTKSKLSLRERIRQMLNR